MNKKFIIISALTLIGLSSCNNGWHPEDDENYQPYTPPVVPVADRKYAFDETGPDELTIHNYLDRAVTMQQFLNVEGYADDNCHGTADDERMIINLGAKWIHRALCTWASEQRFNTDWLKQARERAERMWKRDPDIIFQGAMFECVTARANEVPIPEWVFEEFELEPIERTFNQNAMKYTDGRMVDQWGANRCVPDITQLETQMWFYFMAVSYMDAGCEALSMQQVRLMGQLDTGWAVYETLINRIRKAAKIHARRGYVILGGWMRTDDGRNLCDMLSYPFRFKEIEGSTSLEAELVPRYRDSYIGRKHSAITPRGEFCEDIPYVLDFDNFGVSSHPGEAANDNFCWGYDEISWFSRLSHNQQVDMLNYVFEFMSAKYPTGHVSFPFCRNVISGPVNPFKGNTPSIDCPTGQGIENTVKELWSSQQ
ncbi:MAG: hypothetical protein MJY62_02125 [Bacteroidales bacterium]|nr:hypothetical protein [Bacteroidales bacterium]